MTSLFLWYLTLTIIGLVTFPLAFWLLPGLPDRGYAFSRTLGLLVWGYVFWMLASLGVLGNNPGGLVFALIVLLILSGWAATKIVAANKIGIDGFTEWWNRQRGAVIVVELLFLAAFLFMAYLRGKNPDLASTEKPMDLMFINSILHSPTFPPNDAWLSGYSISYYYFGYMMAAMLAMLTNTPAPMAFSLMLVSVFSLGALGAWGVVYNLLASLRFGDSAIQRLNDTQYALRDAISALLAPLFVLIVGNVEGFLEVLHARGIGWNGGQGAFWQWLNLDDLVNPPAQPFTWIPERFLWWWRASRVVNDLTFTGDPGPLEVIDEFPFFSFTLGDLHPHVMAIPFAFLAMGLALSVYLYKSSKVQVEPDEMQDMPIPQEQKDDDINLFGFRLRLSKMTFALGALVLGALGFLNTWDFPIYLALFAGAYTLARVREEGWSWMRLADFAGVGLALGIAGIALYLPFYIGFSSQAGGILPNVINPTRGAHLWVMFGTLLIPLFAYLIYQWREGGGNLSWGLSLALGFTVLLYVFSLVFVGVAALSPEAGNALQALGAPDVSSLMSEALARRLSGIAGVGTLVVLLGLVVGCLVRKEDGETASAETWNAPAGFAILMIGIGTLLVIGPEFVYLRDQFGGRMNTVFKFYYQTWLLWGTAAAFGAAVLVRALRGGGKVLAGILVVVALGVGLCFPVLRVATLNLAAPWNLDGTMIYSHLGSDDIPAVEWLETAPRGTLIEAVGGSYSGYGRISGFSGMPTLLGWPGHESQWRGGYDEQGSRNGDIEQIYSSGSWAETEALLKQYNVRYIYIGNLERSTYRVNEAKFKRFLTPVFEQGTVVIYEVVGGGE